MNKRNSIIAILIISVIICGALFTVRGYRSEEVVETMAFKNALETKLLRFHVRANSDTPEDQALKRSIKDKILKYLTPKMKNCKTVSQSKKVARSCINEIESIAKKEIKAWGMDYSVKAYITKTQFPVKKYGDLVFPAGTYQSLQVILGKGKGHNWWCVMFPPLCLTDVVAGTVPYDSKKKIKNVIGSKYYVVIDQGNKKKKRTKVIGRFKIVEMFEHGANAIDKWLKGK